MSQFSLISAIAFAVMILSWLVFVIVFATQKKAPSAPDKKSDRSSIIGIALQGAAYAIVWAVRRPWLTPMFPPNRSLEIALSMLAMVLAVASVWFCGAAFRTLGKQWSLAARVLEGHKLVTEGPYSVVRNPIYTGMFGMLLATGLAVSHWIGLSIAIVVFGIGTFIRVRSEEKLLREAFGAEFDEYARRVPAVIPFII
jgi:protein-S-isoprenylcysteine O-methyltransferase Ste14